MAVPARFWSLGSGVDWFSACRSEERRVPDAAVTGQLIDAADQYGCDPTRLPRTFLQEARTGTGDRAVIRDYSQRDDQ